MQDFQEPFSTLLVQLVHESSPVTTTDQGLELTPTVLRLQSSGLESLVGTSTLSATCSPSCILASFSAIEAIFCTCSMRLYAAPPCPASRQPQCTWRRDHQIQDGAREGYRLMCAASGWLFAFGLPCRKSVCHQRSRALSARYRLYLQCTALRLTPPQHLRLRGSLFALGSAIPRSSRELLRAIGNCTLPRYESLASGYSCDATVVTASLEGRPAELADTKGRCSDLCSLVSTLLGPSNALHVRFHARCILHLQHLEEPTLLQPSSQPPICASPSSSPPSFPPSPSLHRSAAGPAQQSFLANPAMPLAPHRPRQATVARSI